MKPLNQLYLLATGYRPGRVLLYLIILLRLIGRGFRKRHVRWRYALTGLQRNLSGL